MADATSGNVELFKKNFDNAVKNIVLAKQIFKNEIMNVEKSTAAEEYFFQESIYELGSSTQIPRGAEFPADQVKWTRQVLRPKKMGLEARVDWEDTIVNSIDVPARTTLRVANRIARDVDKHCYDIVTESDTPVNINTVATTAPFNDATRANRIPHETIAAAIRLISDSQIQSYEADTLILSPLDYVYVVTNDYVMGSFDASSPDLMKTGVMGTLLGLKVIKHPIVTADKALVLESRKCATYKEVSGLKTEVIRDEGKSITLRGWEYGGAALTDPKSVCLITNTQA